MNNNLPCDYCGNYPTKKLDKYLKHDLGDYHTDPPAFGNRADIEELAGKVGTLLEYRPGHTDLGALGAAVEQVLGGRINVLDSVSWSKMMESKLTRASDCGIVPMLVHGAKDFDIFLLSLASHIRDRFTIAQELGHYYLHSLEGAQPIRLPRFENARLKKEASLFAMTLLMPEEQFMEAFEKDSGTTSLCARFGVSCEAIDMRRMSLGLGTIGFWTGPFV